MRGSPTPSRLDAHAGTQDTGGIAAVHNQEVSKGEGPKAVTSASAIIEHCIQLCCLLSPMDADYCARVIKAIHIMATPGFSTLMVYNKVHWA